MRLDHDLDVVDLVLAVGVEGDDVAHPRVAEGELEAGLQRGALTEVERVAHDGRARLLCDGRQKRRAEPSSTHTMFGKTARASRTTSAMTAASL